MKVEVKHDGSISGDKCPACHPELIVAAPKSVVLKTLTFDNELDAEGAFNAALDLGLDVDWQSPGELQFARSGKIESEISGEHTVRVFAPTVE